MSGTESDAALLERACSGEEDAFRALYEAHRDVVFRFAYRLLGSAGLAEDVAHDCFLSLLEKPGRFDASRASLRTYLCGAARNMALRELRRRHLPIDGDEGPDDRSGDEPGPLEELLGEERTRQVAEAVARLPPLQREALVLFEYDEMSLTEIAEVTGVTPGTISARLHRARRRLRSWLAETDAGGKDV